MGNYNNNGRQFNNNRGGQNTRYNTRPRLSDEERARRAAEYQAKLETQKAKLDTIEASLEFFNAKLAEEGVKHVSIKELYDYLSNDKGIDVDTAKKASDIIYIITDLANARCNREIKANTGDRLNIRVLYIIERFKTAFDKSYHERIGTFMDKYPVLFAWNSEANGENYDVNMNTEGTTSTEA